MKKILCISAVAGLALVMIAGAANATIVNISGTQNGELNGGNDCSDACVGPLINPVQLTLGKGTYTISDAYSPRTGLERGATYDAWNFQSGNGKAWVWHWKALFDDGQQGATINAGNYASHVLFDVDRSTSDEFTSEALAAAFGAETPASTFTLNKTTTLDFVVNDYFLPDNAGGVSLDIRAVGGAGAVPEPATWGLMMIGISLIGATLRRTRRSRLSALA